MTTKVLITYEGNTPLLRREVIDLYHIHILTKLLRIKKNNQHIMSHYYLELQKQL
jgi:hypothetical protein